MKERLQNQVYKNAVETMYKAHNKYASEMEATLKELAPALYRKFKFQKPLKETTEKEARKVRMGPSHQRWHTCGAFCRPLVPLRGPAPFGACGFAWRLDGAPWRCRWWCRWW